MQFLFDQLGLQSLVVNVFWALLIEALGITALIRLLLKAFRKDVARERLFWATTCAIVLLLLLALNRDERPILRIQIARTAFGNQPKVGGFVTMIVRVANIGAPTSIMDYRLDAHFTGGRVLRGQRQEVREPLTMPYEDGKTSVTFYPSDSLQTRTALPVIRGQIVVGRVLFAFPEVDPDSLERARLVLAMEDSWGRLHRAEHQPGQPSTGSAQEGQYPTLEPQN